MPARVLSARTTPRSGAAPDHRSGSSGQKAVWPPEIAFAAAAEAHDQRTLDAARAHLAAGLVSYTMAAPLPALFGSERGGALVAQGRQIAMYLTHTAYEMSLARVAVAFGRDRSTVAHACHRVEDRRDSPAFDRWIEDMEAVLRAAPAPFTGLEAAL